MDARLRAALFVLRHEGSAQGDLLLSYVVWPTEVPRATSRKRAKRDNPSTQQQPYSDPWIVEGEFTVGETDIYASAAH